MKFNKQHVPLSLLALLLLNVPAWGMDMSGMSDMDMPMPAKKETHPNTIVKHHHTKSPKLAIQKSMQTTLPMNMDHETNISHMDHSAMDTKTMPEHDMSSMTMNMDSKHINLPMNDMFMDDVHRSSPPADARSSDYSQGRDFGPIHPPMMMGNDPLMSLSISRLEWLHNGRNNQGAYELEGWWGNDWNRAVLKAEGEISNQSLSDARTELLWRKPISTFWNTELGVRQDSGYVNNRTWLALGINGITPYWLDLDAAFYVRDQSQTELILTAKYDWRITQRLILQPRIETSFYGKNDPTNDIGQGLSEVQSGLRLRYEISRQFAPYIGVESNRHYGKTADLIKAANEQPNQTLAVAGVALWY